MSELFLTALKIFKRCRLETFLIMFTFIQISLLIEKYFSNKCKYYVGRILDRMLLKFLSQNYEIFNVKEAQK